MVLKGSSVLKQFITNHKRGSVIFLSILFSAVISLLALAYVRAIPTEANSFLRSQRSTLAHYAAEAGVFDATARIRFAFEKGGEPSAGIRTGVLNGWGWESELIANVENPPAGSKSLRFYEIISKAYMPGTVVGVGAPARTVRVTVGEETFARYSNFTDRFNLNYLLGGSTPKIEGHAHTNQYYSMQPLPALYSSGGPPAFLGYVTSALEEPSGDTWSDGVRYYGGLAPNEGGTINNNRYGRLYTGGRAGLNTGVARIELPTDTGALRARAWGDAAGFPTAEGLHVNPDSGAIKGGYYFVGHVDKMELAVVAGNTRISMVYGDTPTRMPDIIDPDPLDPSVSAPLRQNPRASYDASPIYPDASTYVPSALSNTAVIWEVRDGPPVSVGSKTANSGQTLIVTYDSTGAVVVAAEVYNGHGNGVHYTSGTILGLQGENKGKRTIATEIQNLEDIVISGPITRSDTSPGRGNRPTSPDDVLGLVCYRLAISKYIPRTGGDFWFYASFVAGNGGYSGPTSGMGGRYFEDWDDTSLGMHNFFQYGAAASGNMGPTGQVDANANGISGFGIKQYYDHHLVNTPPPFFPTTGKLPVRSWREDDGQL